MLAHRPCGACAELVPADTGCEHWDPGKVMRRRPDGRREQARRRAETVAEFIRVMGRGYQ